MCVIIYTEIFKKFDLFYARCVCKSINKQNISQNFLTFHSNTTEISEDKRNTVIWIR